MHFLLISYRLDHGIGAVPDVSVSSEEHGSSADRDDQFMVSSVAQQKADSNLIQPHRAAGHGGGMVHLERSPRLSRQFRILACQR